ncbi:MAG: SAM-dependent methyltransferase [Chlorobi bacterium]|nr:SAM-dependent methyltransferase [Chlorobiota bacterium]
MPVREPILYLIPNFLGEAEPGRVFPPYNARVVAGLRYFIAEKEKKARAFIKKVAPAVPQNELHFYLLNKHTAAEQWREFLRPMEEGHSMGLLSDAGMPAVADPGARVVQMAHRRGFRVEPLVGPSSILLALAASGLDGQRFAFHGYLPIDKQDLTRKIKELEHESLRRRQTQIFIETPYRNQKMLAMLAEKLSPQTLLCVAAGLTTSAEFIRTMPARDWLKNMPDIHKIPAVFLFLKKG